MRTLLIVGLLAGSVWGQTLSPVEIIRRSVERDARNVERAANYTYLQHNENKTLDKNGKVNKTERETLEILMLGGRPYEHLIERDGKPLPAKEAQAEQKKLDKEAAKRAKETDRDRAQREKERREQRAIASELPNAYDFTLLGEERVNGRMAWKIRGEPKAGFKPRQSRAGIFRNMRGTLWIGQEDYEWVRADVEVIKTISWGWFVLRIPPGARIEFTQMRVNDELWVMQKAHLRADAKLGMMKTFRIENDVTYSNYRKFSTESRIVGDAEDAEDTAKARRP
jgi:hypothetical protein